MTECLKRQKIREINKMNLSILELEEFIEKYHKKNYSYFQPSIDDVKIFHKKRIKNALK